MKDQNDFSLYLGTVGGLLPLAALIIFMITLAATGNVSFVLFNLGAFLALCLAFLLTKTKGLFDSVVIGTFQKNMVAVIIMAFLMAGILSQLLQQSGLIQGLIWLANQMQLSPGFLPLITFLACVIIATAVGTSGGTYATVTPVMLPLGLELGADPGVIMGAIISGGIFGDNLAPISDTTIASSLTQDAEVKDVVRTRLPYSLIAGSIAGILFIYFGFQTADVLALGAADIDPAYAPTLVMLILPIVMVVLMFRGWKLITTLIICNLLGIFLSLVFGFVNLDVMFSPESPVAAGMTGMLNFVLYVILLFAILEVTEKSGVLNRLVDKIISRSKSPRQADALTGGMIVFANFAMGGSSPAIVFVGPFVNKITKTYNIARTRGANIMDGLATGFSGLMPYNPSFVMALGLALTVQGIPEGFDFTNIIRYSFHSFALITVFVISIITGIGRTYEDRTTSNDKVVS